MGCNEIQPSLKAWLDGETDESRSAAIAAHVEGCEHCREQVDDYRRLSSLLRGAEVRAAPKPNLGRIRRLVAQVHEEEKTLRLLKRVAAAAAVLLVVTLPFGAWGLLSGSGEPDVAVEASRKTQTEESHRPGGVHADVDTDAALADLFRSLEAGGNIAEGDF